MSLLFVALQLIYALWLLMPSVLTPKLDVSICYVVQVWLKHSDSVQCKPVRTFVTRVCWKFAQMPCLYIFLFMQVNVDVANVFE